MKSLVEQDYPYWHCTIALDAPVDNTLENVLNYLVPQDKFGMKWQYEPVGLIKNLIDGIEHAQLLLPLKNAGP